MNRIIYLPRVHIINNVYVLAHASLGRNNLGNWAFILMNYISGDTIAHRHTATDFSVMTIG